jgi:hypothetical protein
VDAILHLPLDLPPHDAAPLSPVSAHTIFEWPKGTFVENLCPLPDGSFAISVLSEARLDRVWPDGRHESWVQLSAPPTGLVLQGTTLHVCVGVPDQTPAALWKVDVQTGVAQLGFVVEGATFLNGMAAMAQSVLLVNDAASGNIFKLDLERSTSSLWLYDERLSRAPQAPFLPGANGLKVFDGYAYVTSNGRALLCRIPIGADGSAGSLELLAERLRGDDLALDAEGCIYIATHIGHSLDRVGRDGRRVSLANVAQGMAGSTACAFGMTDADRMNLYVTTTGGIIGPPDGVLQPARLVRLSVGAVGASLALSY